MGIGTGSVKLTDVRKDLDLSAGGGMTERAMQNKYGQESGPVSLLGYRGNMNAIQFAELSGSNFVEKWPTAGRYEGAKAVYIRETGPAYKSGNRVSLEAQGRGAGGGDLGTEYRFCARVTQPGEYRLSGKTYCRKPANGVSDRYNQIHVDVVANRDGYLDGTMDVIYQYQLKASSHGLDVEKPINTTFSLSNIAPYVTVIFRNVWLDGGAKSPSVFDFYEFKLERT